MSRKKIDISELSLEKIGDRIKYLRIKGDMTQAQLSEIIGLSKGNISSLEKNRYEPSAKSIIKLSELFEVTTDWILLGNDKKTNPDNKIKINFKIQDEGSAAIKALLEIESISQHTFLRTVADLKFIVVKLKEGTIPSPLISIPENKPLGKLTKEKDNI
ncbi:helix-turn-helix domain-containing protein [Desulfobacter vibrioformis]|uniref:helix-turn-helix domain-containing protein n=1 Tax=Desulfobacter vibrioformis TaxID=34031 RepID=UPI00068B498D|nr:helix-turn-helix transcriptional regulator [Desulfobacter vibrioformis]